ncbi:MULTISPECIES: type II secretion system protein GspD [Asaia]|uniref:type II secretion system protein GspD n=1 Tax=Asaia TaxID=91914 RepID=UPI002FC33758
MSVHLFGSQSEVASQLRALLVAQGFVLRSSSGVASIDVRPPPSPSVEVKPPLFPFVYRPRWRTPAYLASLLSSVFPDGRFSSSRSSVSLPSQGVSSGSGSYSSSSQSSAPSASQDAFDALVFLGTRADISRLGSLLPRVDTPAGEVLVKASVFEVHSDLNDNSTFQTVLAVLGSDFKLSADWSQSALTLKNTAIESVVRSLSSDNRFRVVTAPSLRARSGQPASFNVGQQVPVIGSVSYAGNGSSSTPVQSVEYKQSGVIFSVLPTVHDNSIDIGVFQEISSFINTTTGVNNTPTLQQRSLTSSLSLHDGDVVIMGGLSQSQVTRGHTAFSFLPFVGGTANQNSRSDLLIVLQVVRLNQIDGSPTPQEVAVRARLPRPAPVPLRSVPEAPRGY